MRKAAYLALGVFLFLVTSANAQNQSVMYNFDHEADFSKYKTYRWVSIKSADLGNFQIQEQIKAALEAELQKKGLTKSRAVPRTLTSAARVRFLRRLNTQHTKKMNTARAGATAGKAAWSPLGLPSRNIRFTSGSWR